MVFLPSTRNGSFRVETSNQPSLSLRSATIRPQSLISPSTSVRCAPLASTSSRFAIGTSLRHEDVCLEPGGGCVGGQRSSGVACGRRRQLLQSIVARHGERRTHASRLERAGRIQALVLDQQIGIFAAGQHRRKSLAQRHRLGIGKHRGVAPHALGSSVDRLARRVPANRREIVAHVQRAAIFRTDIVGASAA